MKKFRIIMLLGLICGGYYIWDTGLSVPFLTKNYRCPQPTQRKIKKKLIKTIDSTKITAVAMLNIEAMVLSKYNYMEKPDGLEKISPWDLGLGWGPMSDLKFLKKIDMYQEKRHLYYQLYSKDDNYKTTFILPHASNFHIIPANKKILKTIAELRLYDYIKMKGFLVNLTNANNGKMESSLTRFDTGDGACEIMYITSLKKFKPKKK